MSPLINSNKQKIEISTIVRVGLCSTRSGQFSGRVEPCPYSQLLIIKDLSRRVIGKASLLFIIMFLAALSAFAQAKENVVFQDSLTGSAVVFPPKTKLEYSKGATFLRGKAIMKSADVYIYAMKSQKDIQYTWEEINKFDENKYGEFLNSDPIGNDIDGWFRYYKNKDKTSDFYTCIALIRGHNYAIYLVESSRKMEALSLVNIVTESSFPHAAKNEKARIIRKSDSDLKLWIIAGVFALLAVCCIPLKKKESCLLWCIIIIGLPAAFYLVSTLYFFYSWGAPVVPAIVVGVIAVIVWSCSSWKDVLDFLSKIDD